MFQEAGFHMDMDLHGKTWRGLRKVASRSIQALIHVKEKLSNIHITLLRVLREMLFGTSPRLQDINHLHPMRIKSRAKKGGMTWEEHSRELHTNDYGG